MGKSIQDTFVNLKMLQQLWILMDTMKLRQTKSIYEINNTIALHQERISYQDQKYNISDPNHQFLLREFQNILLRLSMFSNLEFEAFLEQVIETSTNYVFWTQLPTQYANVWRNEEAKNMFQDKYEILIDKIKSREDLEANVYSEYVDGTVLCKILNNALSEDPLLRNLMAQQFENIYQYKEEWEPLILQQREVEFNLMDEKLLIHECEMFSVVMICIKVCFDDMQIKKEEERMQQLEKEEEIAASSKGKKSKKDKKKKQIDEEETTAPQQLELINISPQHIENIFHIIEQMD